MIKNKIKNIKNIFNIKNIKIKIKLFLIGSNFTQLNLSINVQIVFVRDI